MTDNNAITNLAVLRRGPKQDELFEKIRQLEAAAQINEWLSLSGRN
jgi:hypothetical protein